MRKWRRRFQWEKLFPWKKGFPWRIAGRILDRRAIMIYFAAWLLFFAVTPGHKGAMAILGGFSPQESRGMDILGCSSWHFQRMFTYMAGIPLSEYIRRRKMSLAAVDLQGKSI